MPHPGGDTTSHPEQLAMKIPTALIGCRTDRPPSSCGYTESERTRSGLTNVPALRFAGTVSRRYAAAVAGSGTVTAGSSATSRRVTARYATNATISAASARLTGPVPQPSPCRTG